MEEGYLEPDDIMTLRDRDEGTDDLDFDPEEDEDDEEDDRDGDEMDDLDFLDADTPLGLEFGGYNDPDFDF